MGFALFGVAVKYLPIFPEEQHAVNTVLVKARQPEVDEAVLSHAGY